MVVGADPDPCARDKPFARFVTPTDVRDLKNRIDPFVVALDANVRDCKTLAPDTAQGWDKFSKAWRAFFAEDESWSHTAAEMDQAEAYECDVSHWQTMLAAQKCAPDAPPITPTNNDATGGASGAALAQTIKVVAIAAAVVAGALAIREVAK